MLGVLLYIDDVHHSFSHSSVVMFADEIALYKKIIGIQVTKLSGSAVVTWLKETIGAANYTTSDQNMLQADLSQVLNVLVNGN